MVNLSGLNLYLNDAVFTEVLGYRFLGQGRKMTTQTTIVKEKVSTQHLQIGMYICELDRSWLDTPFPFQGFYIRTNSEIKEVRAFCEYVYIDCEKGVKLTQPAISKPSPLLKKKEKKVYTPRSARVVNMRPGYYGEKLKPIQRELSSAHQIMMDLTRAVEQTSFNLKSGNKYDFSATKKLAEKMVESVIRNPNTMVWLTQLKKKGGYTYNHSLKSAVLASVFGRHLGLEEEELKMLATGVLLADVGKTKISSKLLEKTENLTDEELTTVRSHVELGVELLAKDSSTDHRVLTITETHHERYDGSGYPYGLVGEEIPTIGQIAGIVDTFDAMTSKKPYGRQYTPSQAMEWLYKQRNHLFSSKMVDEFIQAVGLYPSGSLVYLSDNSIGLVLSHNKEKRLKPEILLLKDANDKVLDKPKFIDLSKKSLFSKSEKPSVAGNVDPSSFQINTESLLNSFDGFSKLKRMMSA